MSAAVLALPPELSSHLVSTRRLEEKRGCLPTRMAALDELLGGGWPRGCLSELAGARSSGRTSVLLTSLAGAIGQGELVALVDSGGALDARAAERAGVRLDRLVWVRTEQAQALPAADLLIAAGGFGIVAVDLGEMPPGAYGRRSPLTRVPLSSWVRLGRAAERQGTAVLVALPSRALGTFAATSLAIERRGARFVGRGAEPRLLAGLEIELVLARTRSRSGVHSPRTSSHLLLQA